MNSLSIIDMGTNTFQLFIPIANEININGIEYKISVRLGKDGFKGNKINFSARQRAMNALKSFIKISHDNGVSNIYAFGTSAFRNVSNGHHFIKEITKKLKIKTRILTGEEEAKIIFKAVKYLVPQLQNSVIMDIGGGSVEFIFAFNETLLFKSIDIGAQRLLSKFNPSDPITKDELFNVSSFLTVELEDITKLLVNNNINFLIGCAGTFDTIRDLTGKSSNEPICKVSKEQFQELYNRLIFSLKKDRDKIEAISELRSDMIVMALCLIQFILNSSKINEIKITRYSLKEGAYIYFQNQNINHDIT